MPHIIFLGPARRFQRLVKRSGKINEKLSVMIEAFGALKQEVCDFSEMAEGERLAPSHQKDFATSKEIEMKRLLRKLEWFGQRSRKNV